MGFSVLRCPHTSGHSECVCVPSVSLSSSFHSFSLIHPPATPSLADSLVHVLPFCVSFSSVLWIYLIHAWCLGKLGNRAEHCSPTLNHKTTWTTQEISLFCYVPIMCVIHIVQKLAIFPSISRELCPVYCLLSSRGQRHWTSGSRLLL